MHPDHPCPKCRRVLRCRGEVNIAGRPPVLVYQCDDCRDVWRLSRREIKTPLTFAVEPDGRLIGFAEQCHRV